MCFPDGIHVNALYCFPHSCICIIRVAAMTLSTEYEVVIVGLIIVDTEMTAKGKRARASKTDGSGKFECRSMILTLKVNFAHSGCRD